MRRREDFTGSRSNQRSAPGGHGSRCDKHHADAGSIELTALANLRSITNESQRNKRRVKFDVESKAEYWRGGDVMPGIPKKRQMPERR
jgi:hypothetical protein